MNRRYTVLFAVVAALMLTGSSVASTEIYGVDADHDLADDDRISEFESEGVVTGEADNLNLTLTASKTSEHVATDQLTDAGKLYLEVDYDEDIARTLRIYVPDDYFEPHTDKGMTVHNADVTATMEPVEDGNYTAVTIHTDGPTEAVLEISTVESRIWKARHDTQDWVSKATGFELPTIGGTSNPWTYVDSSEFSGDGSASAPSGATVQYNAAEDATEATWLEAPECSAETPVCTVEQGNETSVLAANESDVPQVRYKTDASIGDRIGAGVREVTVVAERQLETIRERISEVMA